MSSAEGFRVKTLVSLEKAQESTANGAAYGQSIQESFAYFDRESSSWRTSQRSLMGGWIEFSETWPRAGTMQNGIAYRQRPLVPITFATESSLWPTPRYTSKKTPHYRNRNVSFSSANLEEILCELYPEVTGKRVNRDLFIWMMGFPNGHLELEHSETPSSLKSPNGSDAE
jgi:hypothetical protein